ncbi:MAG: flagellar biosynthesis anti-sigma factor FlgM [Pirellula sp.]|jgi:anti-sigma28 factor (negative regulator of flagellin synthesis)|nr:flagellar biosynthesis anti-sigma factor FlgM [Pirellula sp.]
MQISNNFSVSGADALRSASKASAPNEGQTLAKAGGIQEPVDLIELSPEALSVGGAQSTETFRTEKVTQMREAIAAGKYDTDEMLEKAFDRMLDRYL